MREKLFSIGPLSVKGYGFMIAIGLLFAYIVAERRAKKQNLEYEKIIDLTIWAIVGGMLGAKLMYCIVEIKEIIAEPKVIIESFATGFVVYGGIIGGIFSGWLFCRIKKLNFVEYFDMAMPSVALAQGFGRIGCFLAGCCYGRETTSKFCITFHNSNMAPNNVPLIPTQLISSGLDFLNFFVLIMLAKYFAQKKNIKGFVAGAYLTFYSIGRFILEFYRGDLERGSVGKLSTAQFTSLFCVLVGVIILIVSVKFANNEKVVENANNDK